MSHKWYIISLLALSFITRFLFFGHPNETVFDEVHFGKFISGYYTREYFFDIHPPLGKLAIAGFAKLSDFKPGFAFQDIGNKYPNNEQQVLRFLPSLAGAFLPLVIYLLILEMGLTPIYAFIGGMLIVFESGILTQSHYILLDSFLLLFGFLSLLFYFKYLNNPPNAPYWFLATGLASGLAISVKWTGLGFLGLPLLFELIRIIKNREFKKIITILIPTSIIAVSVYSIIFIFHLIILNKSGPGDTYMSQGFQKTLIDNKVPVNESTNAIPKSNLLSKFMELNAEMYKANQRLTTPHPYSSQWHTWPLMTRPIYYWVKDNPSAGSTGSPQAGSEQVARIYLIGNPIIWWLSTSAVILLLLKNLKFKILNLKFFEIFLFAGYIVNMLPFIGVKRVMFLYHYFTAYIFAILILVWLIAKMKNPKLIIGVLLVLVITSFIFFAPLSYGLSLSPKDYELRVWFASWK